MRACTDPAAEPACAEPGHTDPGWVDPGWAAPAPAGTPPHPANPPGVVGALVPSGLSAAASGPDGGAEAKRIARAGSEAERAMLARQAGTAPELLYYLAGDTRTAVRAAVAANAATPPQADRILAGDADPRVRAILGRKLAALAPRLGGESPDRLRRLAWETLCRLAADAAVTVRAMIAEEVKAMPDAPRALILKLAADASMQVAEPVIRFSPQLTDEDLLALVAAPPVPETLLAIARRPHISEAVSDALAAEDADAVTALLGNPSAAIREATLDRLIARASTQLAWQERLVARPGLPPRAALALTRCVADHLLAPLAARPDLGAELAAALRAAIAGRLEARAGEAGPAPQAPEPCRCEAPGGTAPWTADLPPVKPAPLAPAAPTCGEAVTRALDAGDRAAILGLLSARAGVSVAMARRAIALRSAKALVSLCWKARLSPHCALRMQTVMARIAPPLALHPGPDGDWPLSESEMAWQLSMLAEAVAEETTA